MKAKKIIGKIAKLSLFSSAVYFAYKLGKYQNMESEHNKQLDDYCDFQDDIYTEGEPYEPVSRGDNS